MPQSFVSSYPKFWARQNVKKRTMCAMHFCTVNP